MTKDKSQAVPKKQRTYRQDNSIRYLSVGFINNEEFRSSSNVNCILSGGMSTNEDTYASNGPFKRSEDSSLNGNSSELQTTKVSNENIDKENKAYSSGLQASLMSNRIGDIIDKRRAYQS
jgi:hypothetical protein